MVPSSRGKVYTIMFLWGNLSRLCSSMEDKNQSYCTVRGKHPHSNNISLPYVCTNPFTLCDKSNIFPSPHSQHPTYHHNSHNQHPTVPVSVENFNGHRRKRMFYGASVCSGGPWIFKWMVRNVGSETVLPSCLLVEQLYFLYPSKTNKCGFYF